MRRARVSILKILKQLESFYGVQEPNWPTDPYLFLVWWHCGYPASDAACTRGWEMLNREIGVEPEQLLAADPASLASALKPGGMVPELRAMRLKEIALRVKDEFGGDLRAAVVGPIAQVRKILKKFPKYRRSRRRPHTPLCGPRTYSRRSVQLPARTGAHSARARAREL